MSKYAHIPHPLFNLPGSSREKRLVPALDPETIQVDGRSLADILDFIYRFSGQVYHYDQQLELGDWRVFFADSLPFLIARIYKWEVQSLEDNLLHLSQAVEQQPEPENLNAYFAFVYAELLCPIVAWQLRFAQEDFSFGLALNSLVAGNLQIPLKSYIALANGVQKQYCIQKQDFRKFQQLDAWGLDLLDLFACDDAFKNIPGRPRTRILAINRQLSSLAARFLEAIIEIQRQAPNYLPESLLPLQEEYRKKHAPHLGLLFTFLELFQRFQLDLNKLTTRHLEFFYNQVLGIQARDLTPDQAHLVFEIQKHLDGKLLSKGLLFLDGKDDQDNDIFFRLEEDIVVDKAQVESLRTLYLKPGRARYDSDKIEKFLEGVYIAPQANTQNGQGVAFKEAGSSWATLGDKESKYFLPAAPPAALPELHPSAQLGFILASPVLLLQEGTRKIEVILCLRYRDLDCIVGPGWDFTEILRFDEAIRKEFYLVDQQALEMAQKDGHFSGQGVKFLKSLLDQSSPNGLEIGSGTDELAAYSMLSIDEKKYIKDSFKKTKAFQVLFSGEGGWLEPDTEDIEIPVLNSFKQDECNCPDVMGEQPSFSFAILVSLKDDFPAITFADPDVLQEDYQARLPMMKISFYEFAKVQVNTMSITPTCDLEPCSVGGENVDISLYFYLRHFYLCDACINVEVCGVRNLLVQNEENLQDINSLVTPFGVRPKIDAEFYIGSKEIFCKNWKQFRLNTVWKDKPASLTAHYATYSSLEDDPLLESDFQFLPAILHDRTWQYYNDDPLSIFADLDIPLEEELICEQDWTDPVYEEPGYFHEFNRSDFPSFESGPLTAGPLQPFDVNTQKGFLKIVLKGSDFLHDIYPFELARAMIKLSGGIDPRDVEELRDNIYAADLIRAQIEIKVNSICDNHLNFLVPEIENAIEVLNSAPIPPPPGIIQRLGELRGNLNTVRATANAGNAPLAVVQLDNILRVIAPLGILRIIENAASDLLSRLNHSFDTHIIGIRNILEDRNDDDPPNYPARGVKQLLENLAEFSGALVSFADDYIVEETIPNEPYDPIIKFLSIDYCAKAQIEDIQLIHLYPYEGTYDGVNFTFKDAAKTIINSVPLLPTFKKEGYLFIGLKDYTPGNNLHLLFQLAESTADPESNAARIDWKYLRNNEWRDLKDGFHVLSDTTEGLTRSGIVKLAVPEDITNGESNTIMPPGLHWIQACAWNNTAAVAETIGIHTQAARVSYLPQPDNLRLDMMLKAGSIAKLAEADSSLKGINQFYETFGGQLPESSNSLYQRVSEQLRHKGRSVDKYDYERIVLDGFPDIFRVKTLNHSFSLSANQYRRDLEIAPGFVSVVLIPDITRLKSGAGTTPKVPVSLLNKIRAHLRQRTSPFVRLRVMNPRYEKVNISGKIILRQGVPQNFFQNKLREDLLRFLAPWVDLDLDQLNFGRVISKSEVVRYIESLEYVDYICELALSHEEAAVECYKTPIHGSDPDVIVPATARSILIGGSMEELLADRWRCPTPKENCKEPSSTYKANCKEEPGASGPVVD